MQKFTRPITREVELAGTRLALTLTDQGVAIRIVGTRRPPWEMSWRDVLLHLSAQGDGATLEAAVEAMKKGEPAKNASVAAETPTATSPMPAPSAERVTRPGASEIAELLGRLERWLAANRPRYLNGLRVGADRETLDEFATTAGFPLPKELRTLLSWRDGQREPFIGHFENNWDLMSSGQMAEAKRSLDQTLPEGWEKTFVPFLQSGTNYVVIDTAAGGAVRDVWHGRAEHPIVADSLAVWLARFVDVVEVGGYVEDDERGTFLRKT